MKSNGIKKVVGLIMAITMLMVSTVCFASGTVSEKIPLKRWTGLYACDNILIVEEDAYRQISLYASTETYLGYYAGLTAQLQRSTDGGFTWDDVPGKYWDVYDDFDYCSLGAENIRVSAGKYRVELVHEAYDQNGRLVETFECLTNVVTVY